MEPTRFFMERFEDRSRIVRDMKVLYPTESAAEKTQVYYSKKKKLFLEVFVCGTIISLLLEISTFIYPALQENNRIMRRDYNAGDQTVHLNAYYAEGTKKEEIFLQISERQYGTAQVEKLFSEVMERLPDSILGNNTSLDEIRNPMNLMREVEGCPVQIRWKSADATLIDSFGVIQKKEIAEEGILTNITAVLTYKDHQAESKIYIRVLPPLLTAEEKIIRQIHTETVQQEADSVTEAEVLLPEQVEQETIIWREKREHKSLYLLLLSILSAVVIYFGKDKEIHKLVNRRKREMELDYAEIVSKLTLFLGAGMTVKGAWYRIVEDYLERCEAEEDRRYAYEEMKLTHYEMCSGISETKAYERFGQRSALLRYQVLSSILSQGVRRGTQGTIELLLREMTDAFEERKRIAKQLGEEAGTKLLIPLFMMLVIVMLMILLPAMMSLRAAS